MTDDHYPPPPTPPGQSTPTSQPGPVTGPAPTGPTSNIPAASLPPQGRVYSPSLRDKIVAVVFAIVFGLGFMMILPSSRRETLHGIENIYNAIRGRTSLTDVQVGECYKITDDTNYQALDQKECDSGDTDVYRVRWVMMVRPTEKSEGVGCSGGYEVYPVLEGGGSSSSTTVVASADVCFDELAEVATWANLTTLAPYQVMVGDCVTVPPEDPPGLDAVMFDRVDCDAPPAGVPSIRVESITSYRWVTDADPIAAKCEGTAISPDPWRLSEPIHAVFCGRPL